MLREVECEEDILRLVREGDLDRLKNLFLEDESKRDQYLSTKDWSGDGLLSTACWHGQFDVAQWLLDEQHVFVNQRNMGGSTPLHRACFQENLDIIRLLCNHGANLMAKDNSGKTPKDVGNDLVRRFIQERIDVQLALYEIKLAELSDLDRKWELQQKEMAENLCFGQIRQRCSEAVPVVVVAARVDIVKGSYDPIPGAIHCDWPVYLRRELKDMVLIFHCKEPDDYSKLNDNRPGEWLIFHRADMFPENLEEALMNPSRRSCYHRIMDETMCYVRLLTEEPTFPELRVEGNNNVIEYDVLNGMFIELPRIDCSLEVLSEAFVEAVKETARLKAEVLANNNDAEVVSLDS